MLKYMVMDTTFIATESETKKRPYIRKAKLRSAFHEAGMRLTRQRLAIYRELTSRFDHPDVDHIYQAVKPKVPQISLFTVYRTMNALEGAGMVQRVATWKGHARYDGNVDMHAHFLCEQCGRLDDVEMQADCDEMMAHARSCVGGGEVHRVDVMMSGVCHSCLASSKEA